MATRHSGEDHHVRTIQACSAGPASADGARLRGRGDAARRAHGRPSRPRRRAAERRSATCARASTRCSSCSRGCAAGTSRRTGSDDHPAHEAYRTRSPGPSGRRRTGCVTGDRRLRRPDLRVPAARGRPGLRAPRRPGRRPGGDPRTRARPAPHDRSATRCSPTRRWSAGTPRPARHLAHEGGRPAGSSARAAWRRCAASAILPGARRGTAATPAAGIAIKIEDGDGYERGTWAATVEALAPGRRARRPGAPRPRPLPPAGRSLDPHGRVGGRGGRRVRARARGRARQLG